MQCSLYIFLWSDNDDDDDEDDDVDDEDDGGKCRNFAMKTCLINRRPLIIILVVLSHNERLNDADITK